MHLRPSIGCLILISALGPTPLHAQTDQPSSTAPVTRAIAVYEWTGLLAHPTAARLLPVSLFIHGQLQDAGVYLAQPIPFALQPDTLYLLQRTGQTGVPDGRSSHDAAATIGAFAIQSAHTIPSTTAAAWAAYGHFLTPTEAAAATAQMTPATTRPGAPGPDSRTRVTTQPPPPPPAALKHEKKTNQQASVTPPTTPILDDPDRPILQSGQPAAPATTPELTTLPPDLHQAAAVSDAANRAPETFAYAWPSPAAHDETLQALEALVLPQLTHYLAFNHLTSGPTDAASRLEPAALQSPPPSQPKAAAPPSPSSSRPERAARSGETPVFPATTAAPTLLHTQLLAYTLTDHATPTYILTAELPLTTEGFLYLTLIARPNATGNLHLTLVSITDATHLDRTPRLIPIDAVDPDATGRANLLFELRSQTTRQFALYALTAAQPQQTLLTTPIQ